MKAFLLAAGFGERMLPITRTLPKPLIPVINVPSICYALTLLKESGVTDVVCNLHHLPGMIRVFFKENRNFGFNIIFSHEEDILGTGGGLYACRKYLEDDDFIVINSDILTDISLPQVVDYFHSSDINGLLVLSHAGRENATVAVAGDVIADINNLQGSGITPIFDYMGIAVLTPLIFPLLEKGFSCLVRTGFKGLIESGGLGYYEHRGLWHDIGTPERLRSVSVALLQKGNPLAGRVEEATGFISAPLSKGAVIESGVDIVDSVIGAGCRIAEGSSVIESVLLPGAVVPSSSRVFRELITG